MAPGLKGTFWLHTGNKLSLINSHLHGAIPSSSFLTDPRFLQSQCLMGRWQPQLEGGDPPSQKLSGVSTSNISITWEHLGSLSWGPTPNLLNHNLFYKIPRWSVCMLKFEMHWSNETPPSKWFVQELACDPIQENEMWRFCGELLLILLGEIPSWMLCGMWHLELP